MIKDCVTEACSSVFFLTKASFIELGSRMVLLPLTISLLARFLISDVGPSNVTLFLCDISDMLLRALPMDGSVEPFVESFQALAYVNYLEIALSTHDALLPVDPMLDLLPPTHARVSSNSKHLWCIRP